MHAIIHTKGAVLGNTYVPLELAYQDTLGTFCYFLITSPMNYSKMVRHYPGVRSDVLVTTTQGTSYSDILHFLRNRFEFLQNTFPDVPVVFGCKGESYQPKILRDAGISNIVNVEKFGVPSINRGPIPTVNPVSCPYHKGNLSKCAAVALQQIVSHFR